MKLVVCSQINHVRKLRYLIESNRLSLDVNSKITVLLTAQDQDFLRTGAAELEALEDSVDFEYFRLKLPILANQITNYRARKYLQRYRSVLDEVEPSQVWVFSYESHYAILLAEAEARSIERVLVEDGLGTYSFLAQHSTRTRRITNIFDAVEVARSHRTSRGGRSAAVKVRRGLSHAIRLLRVMLFLAGALSPMTKSVVSVDYRNFSRTLTSNPAICSLTFSGKHEKFLPFKLEAVQANQSSPCKSIFALQTFSFGESLLESILLLAKQNAKGTLELVPHPRSKQEEIDRLRTICEGYDDLEIRVTGEPIENLILGEQPCSILSISSSTLIYAKDLCPNSELISIRTPLEEALTKLPVGAAREQVKSALELQEVLAMFPGVRSV